MNHLSWFLYWIGTANALWYFFGWLAFFGTVSMIFFLISYAVHALSRTFTNNKEHQEENFKISGQISKTISKIAFPLFLVGWLGVVFVPSKDTLLLIAASEIGERIINNPKVQDIADPSFDLLKTFIKKETKDLSDKMLFDEVQKKGTKHD